MGVVGQLFGCCSGGLTAFLLSCRPQATLRKMRERRQVPRYISDLKAQLAQGGSGTGAGVKVLTLSVKGACVEGAGRLKRGQKCELKIDWNNQGLRLDVEVMWKDDKDRAGLKFLSVELDSQTRLREICSTLKLQPLQPPQVLPPFERKTDRE